MALSNPIGRDSQGRREWFKPVSFDTYKKDLKTLREFFSGFESENGYRLDVAELSSQEKRREVHTQAINLRRSLWFPHASVDIENFSRPEREVYSSVSSYTLPGHLAKKIIYFTPAKSIELSMNPDGSVRVAGGGMVRDIYPFDKDMYLKYETKYLADFMRVTDAKYIMLGATGNIITMVYRPDTLWEIRDVIAGYGKLDDENTLFRDLNTISVLRSDQANADDFRNAITRLRGKSNKEREAERVAYVEKIVSEKRAREEHLVPAIPPPRARKPRKARKQRKPIQRYRYKIVKSYLRRVPGRKRRVRVAGYKVRVRIVGSKKRGKAKRRYPVR